MAAYRTRDEVIVQAIQVGDGGYQGIVDWLQANYSGDWSIVGSNDPAAVKLEFVTVTGRKRAAIGDVVVAEPPIPASVLVLMTPAAFLSRYEPAV